MDEPKKEYINAWIQKAEHDLQNADIILQSTVSEKPYDTVCFHCQQAAEKYIKAYLVLLDVIFPKTHNIAQLLELGAVKDPDFRTLAFADELTPFGADIRYPDDFLMPGIEDAGRAFDLAQRVKQFVILKMVR